MTRLTLCASALGLLALACSDDGAPTPGATALAGAGSGSAAPMPAECATKPGALRGRSAHTLMAGGLARSFIHYAPASLNPRSPAPVVIVPHGFMMNADMMIEITKYTEIADREGLVVMFPNGQPAPSPGPWNVGSPDCGSTLGGSLALATGDDNAFIDALLEFAGADQCLDRAHVFMTGFSMGGYFANESACLRSDIAAIGPHSGGTHDLASCPGNIKPVLVMHFEGDSLIPYQCGAQSRDRWLARNGCQGGSASADVTEVKGGRCEYYKGCPANGQVAMCSFVNPPGMRTEPFPGHGWSGGAKGGSANGGAFAIPETESASELSMSFFKKYAW